MMKFEYRIDCAVHYMYIGCGSVKGALVRNNNPTLWCILYVSTCACMSA